MRRDGRRVRASTRERWRVRVGPGRGRYPMKEATWKPESRTMQRARASTAEEGWDEPLTRGGLGQGQPMVGRPGKRGKIDVSRGHPGGCETPEFVRLHKARLDPFLAWAGVQSARSVQPRHVDAVDEAICLSGRSWAARDPRRSPWHSRIAPGGSARYLYFVMPCSGCD